MNIFKKIFRITVERQSLYLMSLPLYTLILSYLSSPQFKIKLVFSCERYCSHHTSLKTILYSAVLLLCHVVYSLVLFYIYSEDTNLTFSYYVK